MPNEQRKKEPGYKETELRLIQREADGSVFNYIAIELESMKEGRTSRLERAARSLREHAAASTTILKQLSGITAPTAINNSFSIVQKEWKLTQHGVGYWETTHTEFPF